MPFALTPAMSMLGPVLIATDLSIHSDEALRFALRLRPAPLRIVHALTRSDPSVYGLTEGALRRALDEGTADGHITTAVERATERAGSVPIDWQESADPAATIVEAATEAGADLVVVGTHGRTGFQRLALGSVAERVLRQAPCPILVVPFAPTRPWSEYGTRTVVCAVSMTASGRTVADAAVRFAEALGADAPVLLHAADGSAAARLRTVAEGAAAAGEPDGIRASLDEDLGPIYNAEGDAGDAILRRAEAVQADLLVVGTGQRTGAARALGSVAARVVRAAPCPVLVVPTPNTA